MFRDPDCWLALRRQLENIEFKKKKPIKIWIAGCSTGEEIISLTILLDELKLLDQTKLVATDINNDAISTAKKYALPKTNLDLMQSAYVAAGGKKQLTTYFQNKDRELLFNPRLVQNTKILKHNLVSDLTFNNMDLIICRNVLIYFSQQLQNTVITRFHESSNKQAYLFLGKNESLDCLPSNKGYELINSKEKIYKKL